MFDAYWFIKSFDYILCVRACVCVVHKKTCPFERRREETTTATAAVATSSYPLATNACDELNVILKRTCINTQIFVWTVIYQIVCIDPRYTHTQRQLSNANWWTHIEPLTVSIVFGCHCCWNFVVCGRLCMWLVPSDWIPDSFILSVCLCERAYLALYRQILALNGNYLRIVLSA